MRIVSDLFRILHKELKLCASIYLVLHQPLLAMVGLTYVTLELRRRNTLTCSTLFSIKILDSSSYSLQRFISQKTAMFLKQSLENWICYN